MRTTVTVDPDVEALLRQAMQQSGQTFKTTLNQAIRRGLADVVMKKDEKPFVVKAKNMGLRPGIDIANIHDLEAEWEVEAFLDVTRKLEERLKQRNQEGDQNGDRT
ncbi:MAG: hypothetical protein SH868_16885 [Bythopirellula sp.]|nr:hypothetical protein [Bythopirellula sp.]